jgi:hypothetical protein
MKRAHAVSAMMTVGVIVLLWQSARSQEKESYKESYEVTALGVISEDVRKMYAREVEVCYDEAGKVAHIASNADIGWRYAGTPWGWPDEHLFALVRES